MTEPTRDALHAGTLAWLASYDQQTTRTDEQQCLAYAAECVRKRAALEAEVASHTAYKLSLLDALGPGVEGRSVPDAIRALKAQVERLTNERDDALSQLNGILDEARDRAAVAAATREGTDA